MEDLPAPARVTRRSARQQVIQMTNYYYYRRVRSELAGKQKRGMNDPQNTIQLGFRNTSNQTFEAQ